MVITYHGGECFKVSFANTTIALNPISKSSKLKQTRFGSDLALVTLADPDFNGVEQVANAGKEPFVISGPGEYEVGNVAVRGFESRSNYNGENRPNTIYLVTLEGMNLCFLGALGTKGINSKALEEIDNIHILFVPIGGDGVLSASDAHDISVSLQPNIVVPMHYGEIGKKDALKTFLKEEGAEGVKPVDKLTVKKSDVESRTGDVVVLSS
ncbi:MAG: MBL fold metallo-hydrolase [Parcubacteria group bacterium]|nr:MBL fold metallo-hydrolase [Parcubacteria group bacterium]